jgi:hypothetical protein
MKHFILLFLTAASLLGCDRDTGLFGCDNRVNNLHTGNLYHNCGDFTGNPLKEESSCEIIATFDLATIDIAGRTDYFNDMFIDKFGVGADMHIACSVAGSGSSIHDRWIFDPTPQFVIRRDSIVGNTTNVFIDSILHCQVFYQEDDGSWNFGPVQEVTFYGHETGHGDAECIFNSKLAQTRILESSYTSLDTGVDSFQFVRNNTTGMCKITNTSGSSLHYKLFKQGIEVPLVSGSEISNVGNNYDDAGCPISDGDILELKVWVGLTEYDDFLEDRHPSFHRTYRYDSSQQTLLPTDDSSTIKQTIDGDDLEEVLGVETTLEFVTEIIDGDRNAYVTLTAENFGSNTVEYELVALEQVDETSFNEGATVADFWLSAAEVDTATIRQFKAGHYMIRVETTFANPGKLDFAVFDFVYTNEGWEAREVQDALILD